MTKVEVVMRSEVCTNGHVTKVEVVMCLSNRMKEYCLLISTAILKHHTSFSSGRESVENWVSSSIIVEMAML